MTTSNVGHAPPYPNAATDPFNKVPGMNKPREDMTADIERPVICSKCGAKSGDDWSQCRGICPLPDSPNYKAAADVELLPEPYGYLRDMDGGLQMSIGPVRPADRAGGYATPWVAMYDPGRVRANVAHATAAKDAKIAHERWLRDQAENRCVAVEDQREALRSERDFLVEEYERAVGCGPQGYTHAAMHLFNAITNAQADQNAKVIVALREEVKDYRTNGAAAVRFAPSSAHWSKELRRLFGDDARTGIEVLENRHRQELARAERLAEALREAADMLLADYPETAKRLRALLPTAVQADEADSA